MTEERPKKSLRMRQKEAVRDAIREAAFRLFESRGFDDVAIEEITEEAGVSPRTFFRYFPTKEDVALDWLDSSGPIIRGALQEQGPEVPIHDAISNAFAVSAATGEDFVRHLAFISRLALDSPRLRAGLLVRRQTWADALEPVVARRMNLGEDALEPKLWAAIAIAIASTADEWAQRYQLLGPEDALNYAFELAWSKWKSPSLSD